VAISTASIRPTMEALMQRWHRRRARAVALDSLASRRRKRGLALGAIQCSLGLQPGTPKRGLFLALKGRTISALANGQGYGNQTRTVACQFTFRAASPARAFPLSRSHELLPGRPPLPGSLLAVWRGSSTQAVGLGWGRLPLQGKQVKGTAVTRDTESVPPADSYPSEIAPSGQVGQSNHPTPEARRTTTE